jgi:carbon monoxide dehydrogenase subunit G
MRFDLAEPVAAPPAQVFAAVSDFEALAAQLAGGRMQVVPVAGADARWDVAVHVSGSDRTGEVWLADITPGARYVLEGAIDGIGLTIAVTVTGRAPEVCDLLVVIGLKAQGLRAKVLLTSLKLVEGQIADRLAMRLATVARRLEGPR